MFVCDPEERCNPLTCPEVSSGALVFRSLRRLCSLELLHLPATLLLKNHRGRRRGFRNLSPWRSTLPRQRLCMNWYKRQSRRTRRLRPLSTLGRHREMFPNRLRPFPTRNSRYSSSAYEAHALSRATVTAISPTSGSAS